ncbi:hypothetical protein ACIGZJ_30885 [Kitasatospora sp. NPDC052868]|uniref:hypothetical protein n=1 Tax=Kitasatospora sp. NPDC052868 TaxID=3364060 RepID=UPI0037CC7C1A
MSARTAPRTRRYRTGLDTRRDIPDKVVRQYRGHLRGVGEHLLWQGPADHAGTPFIGHDYAKYSVLRIAWLLHHDTAPDGHIRVGCGVRGCVAGRCLTDRTLRQREQLLLAAVHRIDMSGTCAAGHAHAEHGSVRTNGKIECRTCDAARRRAQRAADKAVA